MGGRMKTGETPEESMARLVLREQDLRVNPSRFRLLGYHSYHWARRQQQPSQNGTCDLSIVFTLALESGEAEQIRMDEKEYSEFRYLHWFFQYAVDYVTDMWYLRCKFNENFHTKHKDIDEFSQRKLPVLRFFIGWRKHFSDTYIVIHLHNWFARSVMGFRWFTLKELLDGEQDFHPALVQSAR
jgi:hypothetical protein